MNTPMILAALTLAALAASSSACGGRTTLRTVTVVETVTTPSKAPGRPSTGRAATRRSKPKQPAYVRCDPNVSARPDTTSCGFATNAFYEYWSAGQTSPIEVYSPAAGRYFTTTCVPRDGLVTCSTTDGGSVRFPTWAVDAYTDEAGYAYAEAHDVTPPASAAPGPPKNEPHPEPIQDCDPNYTGACLDPSSPDYDCEGGSGDGPDYTGPVQVVGYDRHGLDSDGDGHACE